MYISVDVARGHDGDGGDDDHPPTHHIPTSCGGCFINRGKGTRKPNLGRRKAGRLHTRQETQNLGLKKITDDKGPVPIRFEWDDKKTLMPLDEHASHWSNYLGELIREMPLYQYGHPAAPVKVVQYQQGFLQDWGTQITFWNDPRNQARAAQNRQNRAKSTVVCRQGSWSLARLRDQMMESSSTREYPSLIHTFFVTHTVGRVFVRDEDQALYDEMLRLHRLGSNIETVVPYTEEEIMAIIRKGKHRGHLP
ncbi:reverse transcriptase domain-containing protein, partial [Tanacetum coccineum]